MKLTFSRFSLRANVWSQMMMSLRLRIAERILTFALCLFLYYPFFIFGLTAIYMRRIIFTIKAYTRIGYKEFGRLGYISRKHRSSDAANLERAAARSTTIEESNVTLSQLAVEVHDVVDTATEEELSFMKHRSPSYLYRMTVWTAREFAMYLLRGQSVSLISEQDLAYAVLNCVFAHSLKWHEDVQMFQMKMEGFDDFYLFKGFYWDAREIWVNKDCTKIKIMFTHGREISWPCSEEDLPEWNLAKLHAQVCMTYYAPGLSHNHVHFVFPSSVVLLAKKHLKPSSFLYRLLEPHTKFTERINYQALNVGNATNNKRSILDRHFFFWQPIPITVEQFVEGIAKKCYSYYYTDYEKHKEKRANDPSLPVHCNFPPPYVSNKELQKIPYLCFLASYYEVIRDFVKSVSSFLDQSECETFIDQLKEYVPGIEETDVVDVITTFIHQVGVVHYCDHETFMRFFARQFGIMCIRTPYEPWSKTNYWRTTLNDCPNMKKRDTFKANPLLLLNSIDVMRTRCFQNVFVDFIPDWTLDLRLATTEYKFSKENEKEAVMAEKNFKNALVNLDRRLFQMKSPIVIPPASAESTDVNSKVRGNVGQGIFGRATNMQLIPLENIIRAVCF